MDPGKLRLSKFKHKADLRAQSSGLTRQMWLLYVTFEDFICLHYPERSAYLLSTSVNIDTYFKSTDLESSVRSTPGKEQKCDTRQRRGVSCASVSPIEIGGLRFNSQSSAFKVVPKPEQLRVSSVTITAKLEHSLIYSDSPDFFQVCNNKAEPSFEVDHALRSDPSNCWHNTSQSPCLSADISVTDLLATKTNRIPTEGQPDRSIARSFIKRPRSVGIESKSRSLVSADRSSLRSSCRGRKRDSMAKPGSTTSCKDLPTCASMEVTQTVPSERWEDGNGQRATMDPLSSGSDTNEGSELAGNDKLSGVNEQTTGTEPGPCANLSTEPSQQTVPLKSQCADGNIEGTSTVQTQGEGQQGVSEAAKKESKLRVSVFDHRLIPKKFISGRILATRNTTSDINITNGAKSSETMQSQLRTTDAEGPKRKGMFLPYAVRRNNASGKSSSGTSAADSPDSNPDGSGRKRFDDLLRGLIGDVSDMQVESSPMTISSGYESDYMQTREAEIDDIFSKTKENTENKENVKKNDEIPTDYFSMSETYPNSEMPSPLKENREFTSLPSFPTQPAPEAEKTNAPETKELPVMRMVKSDKDFSGFSYTQRHNYKLTKVTRSMYEIIHDLQNVDTAKFNIADGRKRSRKSRKSFQDGNSDGSTSAKENRPFARLNSAVDDNNGNPPLMGKPRDNAAKSLSGAVVRCVRRPLASESTLRPRPKRLSSCDGNGRSVGSNPVDNGDKLQTDLRNLLCDTTEVTGSSRADNDHSVDFNGFSGLDTQGNVCLNGTSENKLNPLSGMVMKGYPFSNCDRKPTLKEQFRNRPRPEDHVYETIPGDEKLYEEWKKLRATSKMPRIRRFTTVPDLPGTFVPKEPPALPERRYLNNPAPKETDNYIFMGDVNSNVSSSSSSASDRPDSGYASVSSDKMLDSRTIQCYPIHTDNFMHSTLLRNDETSDGYCSIDNLSLLRDPIASSFPVRSLSSSSSPPDWCPPHVNGTHRYPHNKRNNLIHTQTSLPPRNAFPDSYEMEVKLRGTGLFEYRKWETGSDSDSTLVSSTLEREATHHGVQATYV